MKRYQRKGLLLIIFGLMFLTGCGERFPVLDPAGPVGQEELHLIKLSTFLTMIVVIPVIILLIVIVVKYRDKPNRKAPYQPEWTESRKLEIIWWTIPVIIVLILGTFTAKSIFHLTKPPATSGEPLTVQVTSMDWKWVFMYPEQGIATVNTLEIPTGRPIQFVLTSAGPMNTFWIPKLGGQEMTMPGMALRLWLQSNETGVFTGKGGNFTGKGFAHMTFKVHAVKEADFNNWIDHVKQSYPEMTEADYNNLKKPGVMGVKYFSAFPEKIYMDTVMKNGGKYMNNRWMMNDKNDGK